MKIRAHRSQDAHEDQSELIGLSEINFLLVVALIALVAASTTNPASPHGGPDGQPGEVVRLEIPASEENPPADESGPATGGVPEATHLLQGEMAPGNSPVVIAVPEGFPLENVQFLIQRQP